MVLRERVVGVPDLDGWSEAMLIKCEMIVIYFICPIDDTRQGKVSIESLLNNTFLFHEHPMK